MNLRLILAALAAAACFGTGWAAGGMSCRADLAPALAQAQAQVQAQRAAMAQASQVAQERQAQARQAAQTAQAQLAQALAAGATLAKEKAHALSRATDGHACLRAAAVRVLYGAPGVQLATVDPSPTGPVAAGGATAADTGDASDEGGIVTDAAMAQWAVAAGQHYEACRNRLEALIDFTLATTAAPSADTAP